MEKITKNPKLMHELRKRKNDLIFWAVALSIIIILFKTFLEFNIIMIVI